MRLTKRKKARKGPLSYKDRAQRPRGAGLVTRREFRQGCNYSKATRKAQRAGFNTMWKHAGPYMRRKRIPRAGEFNKRNIHGGMLWGQRKECPVTDKMAGEIIERVFESGKVGIDQLKQVRHSFSYAYYLTTGTGGDNYPEVKAQWRSFALKDLPAVRRPLVPTKIPIPENLRLAYTKQWSEGTVSLADFETGVMCSHDTHIFGCRPNVDIKKVKVSTNHFINPNEGYGWTEMVGGRSKLHLSKAGTRKWKVYRVCFCKGEHQGPPRRIRLGLDGNLLKGKPTWNTVCPLAAMEFMERKQGPNFKCYAKWSRSQGRYGRQNHGDVPTFANKWLEHQKVPGTPFDRNSGRKSLSRWLQHLGVDYSLHVHIHGDLEEVWRSHYQNKLRKSGYREREQASDPDLATKALKLFSKWLHEQGRAGKSMKERLQEILREMD